MGVYQSEVVYGSPSHEPYPDLARETTTSYTYTGGKDNQVRYVDNHVRDNDNQVRDKDNPRLVTKTTRSDMQTAS